VEIYIGIYIFSFSRRSRHLFVPKTCFVQEVNFVRSVGGTTYYNSPGLHGRVLLCVYVYLKKKTKTKCIFILVAKLLIAMVDFIVGRFVSSN